MIRSSDSKSKSQKGSVSARACVSLDQLSTPKKISCTTLSVDLLPTKFGNRPTTRGLPTHSENKQTLLNVVEGKVFQNRSTPIPELNLTPFVSQPQASVARRVVHGVAPTNSTWLPKSNIPFCKTPTKNRSPFVASHTWNSATSFERGNEIELFDNPTVLRFERMSLTTCPALKPEQKCQFLSLQRNRITKIDHMDRLTQLVYLDLSHNQIDLISGLEQICDLRVLILGQNHIRRIEGLDQQINLEVLDLQQNGIQKIENLSHLVKLRVLNLAMNEIVFVNGLSGLISLTDLNLRQNSIVKVEPLSNLPRLNWIQLGFNNIERWTQISGLSKLPSSTKVVLNGNPIVLDPAYRRLMPAHDTINRSQSGRISLSAKQTPTFHVGQRSLGMLTPGHQDTDVYELRQINMHMPDSPDMIKLSTPADCPGELEKAELIGSSRPEAGDTKSDQNRSGENGWRIPASDGPIGHDTEKKDVPVLAPDPWNTLKDETVLAGIPTVNDTSFDKRINKLISSTESSPCTNRTASNQLDLYSPNSNESVILKPNEISKTETSRHKTPAPIDSEDKTNRKSMTELSFMTERYEIDHIYIIQWHVVDRNHIRFEAKLYKEDRVNSLQLSNNEIAGFANLGAALNDLAFSIKSAERATPNNGYSSKPVNLAHITHVSVIQVKWEDFIGELSQIRTLFPEMKCLILKHVRPKRLMDIVALTRLRRLDSLVIDLGLRNSIVQQAGQFWRPFIIWSLKEALGLQELDRIEITSEEVINAASIFRELGHTLIAHSRPYTTTNPVCVLKHQGYQGTDMNVNHSGDPDYSSSLWTCDALWLNGLDSDIEPHNSSPKNKWLSETNASWPHCIPSLLRWNSHEESSGGSSKDEPRNQFHLDEIGIKMFRSAARLDLPSATRRLTVQRFIDRVLTSTSNRLVWETQAMKVWPSVLRRLIEREVNEPKSNTNNKSVSLS